VKPENFFTLILLFCTPTLLFAGNLRQPDLNQLQNGDLIFRTGSGFVSDFARNFSKHDKRFSHVGIIAITTTTINVIHSVHDDEKQYNGVVTEPVAAFLQASSNWAVYRLPLTPLQQNRLTQSAQRFAKQKIPFDSKFDLMTTQNFYCTELIWHAAHKASPDRNLIKNRTLRAGTAFISIEDLYRDGNARLVESLY